jgi:hypothetical protein
MAGAIAVSACADAMCAPGHCEFASALSALGVVWPWLRLYENKNYGTLLVDFIGASHIPSAIVFLS